MIIRDNIKLIFIIIIATIVVFIGNFLIADKYISSKIVRDNVDKLREQIDRDYNYRLDTLTAQIRELNNKINDLEKRRQQIAKEINELKKKREEYKPPTSSEEALNALRGRGYEVSVRK